MFSTYGSDEVSVCTVLSFTSGSIVANVQLQQNEESTASPEQLQSILVTAIDDNGGVLSGSGLGVNTSSIFAQGITIYISIYISIVLMLLISSRN